MAKYTLLLDADDTLWENNAYFEQAISEYVSLLEPLGYSGPYARRVLNETVRQSFRQHGFGIHSFGRSLEDAYMKLAGQSPERPVRKRIAQLLSGLESAALAIFKGVPETLGYLSARHRLILVTEGAPREQAAKLEKSGLRSFFDTVEILREKAVSEYERIIGQYRIVQSKAWMVGNSPQSDINPALAAGLNAVFIPRPSAWELEHAEVQSGSGKLLVLPNFRSLRNHF